MKKLFINLIAIAITGAGFAQTNGSGQSVALTGVTVRPLNISYLNAVTDERMPESVTALENKAARYNVTESEVYDEDFEAYEVVFSQSDGVILATYDNRGRIIESLERFKNITLPYEVRNEVAEKYPGWTFHSDAYLVSYYKDKGVQKEVKIQLRKDGKRKNIKIDMEEL